MIVAGVQYSESSEWRGDRVTRAVGRGIARGLTRGAQRLGALAMPLTPLDRGPLRSSQTVKPATENTNEAAVIYDTPYAVRQHEEMDYAHSVGQAKYLEQPLREHRAELFGIVAKEIADDLANG